MQICSYVNEQHVCGVTVTFKGGRHLVFDMDLYETKQSYKNNIYYLNMIFHSLNNS